MPGAGVRVKYQSLQTRLPMQPRHSPRSIFPTRVGSLLGPFSVSEPFPKRANLFSRPKLRPISGPLSVPESSSDGLGTPPGTEAVSRGPGRALDRAGRSGLSHEGTSLKGESQNGVSQYGRANRRRRARRDRRGEDGRVRAQRRFPKPGGERRSRRRPCRLPSAARLAATRSVTRSRRGRRRDRLSRLRGTTLGNENAPAVCCERPRTGP